MKKIIIIALSLFMCSCIDYKSGTEIPKDVYDSFKIGTTTQEDVKKALGPPYLATGNQFNNDILWSYHFTTRNVFESEHRGLITYFNFNDKNILLKKWQAHKITK